MECRFCKTVNPDEAVFCKKCGKRLDGTTACPNCGKQISVDDEFCMFCGAAMKKHQAEVAVTTAEPAATYAPVPATAESDTGWSMAKKALNYVANSTAILTAVLALIFVFFIGITGTAAFSSFSTSLSFDIKFFFKEGYTQLDQLKEIYTDSPIQYSDLFINYGYCPLIFGTTIFAATIIAVLTLSVKAIVRCTKNLLGKTELNGCNCAVAAFLAFVLGTALLLSIFNISVKANPAYSYSGSDMAYYSAYPKYEFNSPTLAFIIIGAVFTFMTFGCRIASHGKALLNKNAVLKYCFGAGAIVLGAIMLGVVSVPFFTVKAKEGSVGVSLFFMLTLLASSCSTKEAYDACQNADTIAAFIVLSFILLVLIALIVTVCISHNAQNMQDGGNRITLGYHVALVCLCAVLLTFAILTVNEMDAANLLGGTEENIECICVVPIVLLVFSVISLIENLVCRALTRPTTEI